MENQCDNGVKKSLIGISDKAQALARSKHHGQRRKMIELREVPYTDHLEEVCRYLSDYGYDDSLTQSIAWMHDVLEDTDTSYEQLKEEFGEDIADGVKVLTRDEGIPRKEYLQQKGYDEDSAVHIYRIYKKIEEREITYDKVRNDFGQKIYDGVKTLKTYEDMLRQEYNQRILKASIRIQMIKLCDVLDNTATLESLADASIERKIEECNEFYIPLAEEVMPGIAVKIRKRLNRYYEYMQEKGENL